MYLQRLGEMYPFLQVDVGEIYLSVLCGKMSEFGGWGKEGGECWGLSADK